ncbi:MAG: hypothetical protein PHP69_03845 [Candidatus Omnitrophica bacterium]|nr:hypothetical protein [Candidatus Omnitrophota bacterium]MDD5080588.1 hypothetical protein [Candidatus Omnitrophota bacterium]MDD5441482.1 hypothetical protein [Candidatus Omnitrophota bacterium]
MRITRIRLNPEQAVLSCCDTTTRALGHVPPYTCFGGAGDCSGTETSRAIS